MASRRTTRALTAGALLLAFGIVVGAAAAPRAVFGVGVLRRDGIIIPFAAFDGKRWVDNWPPPGVELEVPISLRSVPSRWWGPTKVLERWQAWTGDLRHAVSVVQPDWFEVHCLRRIGLRSDYQPKDPPPPPTEQPYPKDGLVVSPEQAVERIAIVTMRSDEMRALMPAVQEAFNRAERVTENQYGHPIARRAREGREPDIEAIYAVGDRPRFYYVEASRRYRVLGQAADCEAIAFGTGWFSRDGAEIRAVEAAVDLLSCDRRGASYMLPLGAVRVDSRLFWLAQFSGWNHERYVVVEMKPKTVTAVVSSWGGSCRK